MSLLRSNTARTCLGWPSISNSIRLIGDPIQYLFAFHFPLKNLAYELHMWDILNFYLSNRLVEDTCFSDVFVIETFWLCVSFLMGLNCWFDYEGHIRLDKLDIKFEKIFSSSSNFEFITVQTSLSNRAHWRLQLASSIWQSCQFPPYWHKCFRKNHILEFNSSSRSELWIQISPTISADE